jgi:segregation and condensation protein A
LLLPEPPRAEAIEAAGLAEALALRLKRLGDIRRAAEALVNRSRLGRDVFARGAPEGVATRAAITWEASLYELLAAYAAQSQKHARTRVRMQARQVWSLADARDALTRMIGTLVDWTSIDDWLIAYCADPKQRRGARASSFAASLEMVREGLIELRQDAAFAPLHVRPARAEAVTLVE